MAAWADTRSLGVCERLLRSAVVTEGVLDREPDYPVEGQGNRREGHRCIREFAEEVGHQLIQAAFRLSPANTRRPLIGEHHAT